ncbi:hypothetical protein KIL84_019570 [Mauremys mutica]|uniref:Uncharacterized protein n=1 Tax=Mauremys mutica TaxID=74926 RepID=A0A9D3XV58_9SAUR|nr:hypothetical protein KIL84_019570 [Mauremys mutica]
MIPLYNRAGRRLLRVAGASQWLPLLSPPLSRGCRSGEARGAPAKATKKRGYDITRNPHLNKGLYDSYSIQYRRTLSKMQNSYITLV